MNSEVARGMPAKESVFLPNLFLLGAAKCGTTTLHAYLDDLPDVCMSRPKEPFFFEAEFERGLGFYRERYFAHWRGEPVIGDARHRNLYLPYVPERIHAVNPRAKLLVLVRNPIERAFSHWYHYHWQHRDPLGFWEAIQADWKRIQAGLRYDTPEEIAEHARHLGPDERGNTGYGIYRTYLDSGYYYQQIKRYLALYPAENLRVILFEDLVSHPQDIVSELVEFLAMDPATNRFSKERWENPANLPLWLKRLVERARLRERIAFPIRKAFRNARNLWRRQQIDARTRRWLRDHYRDHNRALEEFLQRDLASWV